MLRKVRKVRMLRKILYFLSFLCLLLPASSFAATYYVSAAGNDANNGTTTGTSWAHPPGMTGCANTCASTTVNPGDSVLLNRGDVWYGAAVTVTTSGSSGSPITYGAYGTGANPIIKASTLLTTSGYVIAPGAIVAIFAPADTGINVTDNATRNMRQDLPPNYNGHPNIASKATLFSLSVTASPTANLNITGAGIGPGTTAPNTSAITRITWAGGMNGTTVAMGTTATSDSINYNLDNTIDQVITIYTTARNLEFYEQFGTLWQNFAAPDQSQSATVTGYSTGGNSPIAALNAFVAPKFTYRSALGSAPVAMWENGNLLQLQSLESQAEAIAGTFFWDGTYVYIHASDSSAIPTNNKTYTYVTAASPGFTMWDNGKSWLVIDSIDEAETYNTSSASLNTLGGLILTGSNGIVRNLSIHDNYRHDFSVYIGATNNTLTNIVGYNSYGTSPVTVYGPGTTGNLIQKSLFWNDTYMQERYNFNGDVWTVVVSHGGATGNTLDSSLIISTAQACFHGCVSTATSHGYGILVVDSGTIFTVSHCLIYGPYEWAVLTGNNGASGGDGANVILVDNAIDATQIGSTNDGLQAAIWLHGDVGAIIYNNTVYGPAAAVPALTIASSSTGAIVKNNIFQTGTYASVDAGSESGIAMDYNDWSSSASGTPFTWGGAAMSFAQWQATTNQDAHSLNVDPQLANPLLRWFALGAKSPVRYKGTNLGPTYQNALATSSAWPNTVTLQNQNNYGFGWGMGAFVWDGTINGPLGTPSVE